MPPLGGDNENDILSVLDDPSLTPGQETDGSGSEQEFRVDTGNQQRNTTQVQDNDFQTQRNQMRGDGNQRQVDTRQQQNNQQQSNVQQNNQQQQVDPRTLRPLGRNSGFFTDAKGNVTDQTGRVVASAGRERRLWQENSQARNLLAQSTEENNRLRQEMQNNAGVNDLPRQYGLSADEVREGMTIVKMFKDNPIAAVKDVLARGLAMGYTLQQILGDKVGGGVDTLAMKRMLDERLAPLNQQQQTQRNDQEVEVRARRAYDQFLNDHEFADVHEDAIVNLLNRRQQEGVPFSPEKAYYALREFAIRNNLDFAMPLGPQIAERQAQAANQQQTTPQNAQRNTNGRSPGSTPVPGKVPAINAQVDNRPVTYGEEDDWKDILRREAGNLRSN